MDRFETKLAEVYTGVDRYVKFRLNGTPDAEDLVQEICLSAYCKYDQLKDKDAFKSWVLSIARNACNDYFRRSPKFRTVSIDEVQESCLISSHHGLGVYCPVAETMENLPKQDREILKLYFWEELPQTDIALKLGIPVGSADLI